MARCRGHPHGSAGGWLVLLKYRADDVGTLVRPTFLDARANPYHFVSPDLKKADLARPPKAAKVPAPHGGLAMDLNPNNKTAPLLEEYIHQQLDWKIEHFRAAGNRCLPTESASAMGLREARGRHYDRLVNEFTADVIDPWMSRNLLK